MGRNLPIMRAMALEDKQLPRRTVGKELRTQMLTGAGQDEQSGPGVRQQGEVGIVVN